MQHLDRGLATDGHVLRTPDRSHPAFTQKVDNSVCTDLRTHRRHHLVVVGRVPKLKPNVRETSDLGPLSATV
jgi:hypothetical protein